MGVFYKCKFKYMNIEGHQRVSIDNLSPEIDCGRSPIKRIINEHLNINVDIYGDGQDKVDAVLLYREKSRGKGPENKVYDRRVHCEGNDHWSAQLSGASTGSCEYTIEAWIGPFATWQDGLNKKYEAGQDIKADLRIGAQLMEENISRGNASQKK